jgi:hypothetical protein
MIEFLTYLRKRTGSEDIHYSVVNNVTEKEAHGVIYTGEEGIQQIRPEQLLMSAKAFTGLRMHPPRAKFLGQGFSGRSLGDIANSITLFTSPLDYERKGEMESLLRDYVSQMTDRTI